MTTSIYGLVDPLTHQVSYIGRTIDLYERFDAHLKDVAETLKAKWIKNLRVSGVSPVMIVLEEVDDEVGAIREAWWINFGVRVGWPISNTVMPNDRGDWLAEAVEELLERVANLEEEYRVRPPARQRRPRLSASDQPDPTTAAQLRRLHSDGWSKTRLCLETWGYKDGVVWGYLDAALGGEL